MSQSKSCLTIVERVKSNGATKVGFFNGDYLKNTWRRILFMLDIWFIVGKQEPRAETAYIGFWNELGRWFIVALDVLNAHVIPVMQSLAGLLLQFLQSFQLSLSSYLRWLRRYLQSWNCYSRWNCLGYSFL